MLYKIYNELTFFNIFDENWKIDYKPYLEELEIDSIEDLHARF